MRGATFSPRCVGVRLGTAVIAISAALAGPAAAQAGLATAHTAPIAAASQKAPAALFAARRLGEGALAAQRGGTEVQSDANLRGGVTDNQAINVTTGGNVISGGTLAGASGVPVVIQNSGNNVLIQSSTIVNVQIK